MTISREQGQAIARLMHELRPEWDLPGCVSVVARLKDRDPANLAMAAVRLCATPEAATPGALLNPEGGHWRERVSASPMRYPPKSHESCRKHPGEWEDTCRGCAGDKLAGDDSTFNPRRTEAGDRVATLKALHAQTVANLCSHGVPPKFCIDHRNPSAETEEPA